MNPSKRKPRVTLLHDLSDFLLPRRCLICHQRLNQKEHTICAVCHVELPLTDHHQAEHSPLERRFWGQIPVVRAASMLHHDGEKARRLIHLLKYHQHPEVATHLAALYARQLKDSGFFLGIDCIIPLPLHWRRQLQRGYNQSHYIARGIAREVHLPIYRNVIRRVVNNPSQTTLSGKDRIDNVQDIFRLIHPQKIQGKHLLLIDDVTTTGATIASCARELSKAPGVKISILTLSIASQTPLPNSPNAIPDPSVFGVPLVK